MQILIVSVDFFLVPVLMVLRLLFFFLRCVVCVNVASMFVLCDRFVVDVCRCVVFCYPHSRMLLVQFQRVVFELLASSLMKWLSSLSVRVPYRPLDPTSLPTYSY